MPTIEITPYSPSFRNEVLDLALRAWAPVFKHTCLEVPQFVYEAFYPNGWETRQTSEILSLLDSDPQGIWLAIADGALAGFIGIKLHPEDQMGEIHILAVSPAHQRQGIGGTLIIFAEDYIQQAGMKMVMVETVADTGHAPARHTYEAADYQPWPVARYFKQL
ncbi:MAG: GNAT family N-acetyltransferase [Pseudomonadota bacterium]